MRIACSIASIGRSSKRTARPTFTSPNTGRSRMLNAYLASAKTSESSIKVLECIDVAFGGDGVCQLNGQIVFVPSCLPGELLTARIKVSKKKFARGEKIKTLRIHENNDRPACQHFGPCGGCCFQNLKYDAELEIKQRQVENLLRRVAGINNLEAIMTCPIIPMSGTPYNYRNRMEFSWAWMREQRMGGRFGLHRPGKHDEILPIESCSLQKEEIANKILKRAEELCNRHFFNGTPTVMQHLVIRHSLAQDMYLINFVTSIDARNQLLPIAETLMAEYKTRISGIVNSVSHQGRPLEERRIVKEISITGKPTLTETILGLTFTISPNAFFQTNSIQAQILFKKVLELSEVDPKDTVLDLYCGTGTMTLLFAQRCKHAYGVEIYKPAVENARSNALDNGIDNASFFCADCTTVQLPQEARACDVVVVDPARSGLTPKVIESLCAMKFRRLVYVSCNPATQARDIKLLCSPTAMATLKLVAVVPVDMYPQTSHVETIAILDRF